MPVKVHIPISAASSQPGSKLPEMSEEEQLRLLATDGMLVKRPILINGSKVVVGFKESDYEEAVK